MTCKYGWRASRLLKSGSIQSIHHRAEYNGILITLSGAALEIVTLSYLILIIKRHTHIHMSKKHSTMLQSLVLFSSTIGTRYRRYTKTNVNVNWFLEDIRTQIEFVVSRFSLSSPWLALSFLLVWIFRLPLIKWSCVVIFGGMVGIKHLLPIAISVSLVFFSPVT